MAATDEMAAESATLAAADARMGAPRPCRDCAHFCWLGDPGRVPLGVCCVDRDGGGMGALYEADPDEDQAWDGGCDLWEPQRPALGIGPSAWSSYGHAPLLGPIVTRDTARAASALGLGDIFALGA